MIAILFFIFEKNGDYGDIDKDGMAFFHYPLFRWGLGNALAKLKKECYERVDIFNFYSMAMADFVSNSYSSLTIPKFILLRYNILFHGKMLHSYIT